jgi:CRISPR-associated exonuclease Cas4
MDENDYLPLSYLNQLVYCPRRFWYMYVQGELEVNAHMLEGTLQHEKRADKPGTETDDHGRAVHRRVWVWSGRLQIAGFADFVEEQPAGATILHRPPLVPVEYKHGRQGKWSNDQVQLCAQALCLEEMTGRKIPKGEIFYWRSRRRLAVDFDDALRQKTETAIAQAHNLAAHALIHPAAIPDPISERRKCKECSIQPICLPDEVEKLRGIRPVQYEQTV